MNEINMNKENTKLLLDTRFIRVFDLQYAEGKHYYDATRHSLETLTALQPKEAFRTMLPDAVTCIVVVCVKGEEPRLLLSQEYRYPAGQFLLSPPAGLLDEEDKQTAEPLISAARREIAEETGLVLGEGDRMQVVNPLAFSTPGMSDESNGLVCAVARRDDLSFLSHAGAVGTECFGEFCLLTREEARRVLKAGRDSAGMFYSIFTFAALTWFITGLWEEE